MPVMRKSSIRESQQYRLNNPDKIRAYSKKQGEHKACVRAYFNQEISAHGYPEEHFHKNDLRSMVSAYEFAQKIAEGRPELEHLTLSVEKLERQLVAFAAGKKMPFEPIKGRPARKMQAAPAQEDSGLEGSFVGIVPLPWGHGQQSPTTPSSVASSISPPPSWLEQVRQMCSTNPTEILGRAR